MSGLESPSSPGPEVVAELQRGALLGLLRLEIEAMLLRLEIEWTRRKPQVELFKSDDQEDTWVVRVDPEVWGSGGATGRAGGLSPRGRVFHLRSGKAALKARAPQSAAPETLLAIAHELVAVLEKEIRMPAHDAA